MPNGDKAPLSSSCPCQGCGLGNHVVPSTARRHHIKPWWSGHIHPTTIIGILYPRPSHDHVAGDLLERPPFYRRHYQGSTHGPDKAPRQCCRGCRANESRPSRCDIFSTDRVVSVMWGLATWQGSRWSSARPEARGGRCRKVREGN